MLLPFIPWVDGSEGYLMSTPEVPVGSSTSPPVAVMRLISVLSWLPLGSHSHLSCRQASLYLRLCFRGNQVKAHAIAERQITKK